MSDSGDVRAGAGGDGAGGGGSAGVGGPGAAAGAGGGGGDSGPGAASGEPAPEGLSLRGLRVVYRGARGGAPVTAVDGVDLDVARGQTVALLGASGCGKSSLLRAVAGLEDRREV